MTPPVFAEPRVVIVATHCANCGGFLTGQRPSHDWPDCDCWFPDPSLPIAQVVYDHDGR